MKPEGQVFVLEQLGFATHLLNALQLCEMGHGLRTEHGEEELEPEDPAQPKVLNDRRELELEASGLVSFESTLPRLMRNLSGVCGDARMGTTSTIDISMLIAIKAMSRVFFLLISL